MCAPVVAAVAVGAAVAGGVAQGMAAKKAAKANANAARRNAEVARKSAEVALQRGEQDAAQVTLEGEAIEGQQRVAAAGNDVLVDSGSAARAVESTAAVTQLDVETIRTNAQREAWGLRVGASNMMKDARAMESAGRAALIGGIIGGVAQGASIAAMSFGGGATKAPGKP